MSKKRERFEVTYTQMSDNIYVIVDTETGVNYLYMMGEGIIPLIDRSGKPLVTLDESVGFRPENN